MRTTKAELFDDACTRVGEFRRQITELHEEIAKGAKGALFAEDYVALLPKITKMVELKARYDEAERLALELK